MGDYLAVPDSAHRHPARLSKAAEPLVEQRNAYRHSRTGGRCVAKPVGGGRDST
jgi:hypothetical protein